jgi:GrpB-like predicted nucleotidyltransferase (UPF0157 family)
MLCRDEGDSTSNSVSIVWRPGHALSRDLAASVSAGLLRYAGIMDEKGNARDPLVAAGLCSDCLYARRLESARGSVFILCNLSLTDPGFPKYPRLPVLSCGGHRRNNDDSADPIEVVDYDPRWPSTFETLRAPVAGALGDLVSAIEHVGSTAVPGLAAKPIIDIDVLLKSAADLPLAIGRLASLGYVHRGDLGVPGREAFATPSGLPAHHLYVCPQESQQYLHHLALRNYLRAHPSEAAAYGNLKRSLAACFRDDRTSYIEGKSEFIESLLRRALVSPPASD